MIVTTSIFVNLPVRDLERSMQFFETLGYTFNPQFTNQDAACMVISDTIYAMLLTEAYFQTFTTKTICDTSTHIETLIALSCESRAEVDTLIAKAVSAGATLPREPQDYGFMYQHAYQDLDGHVWELAYMDPAYVQ
jgi:uncharacterized protein